ncbi:peptide ABC transporter ATPase [Natrialba hulunbeirensis JCM 10989]|uniref:Nickel import system ATP-binding protein NikD n=2 Tax=Natrialba hulunbeirensis TaxID=123783 RepID=L9ZT17_9EURY|nr:peptide ABC transporter ATPase [Natrialba hulunbeirensis JCM 10989]
MNTTTKARTDSRRGDPLLTVDNLRTVFDTDDGQVQAVDGIDFTVHPGETVCIVGESGSGKTVTSESITQLFKSPPGSIADGSVVFDGDDLAARSEEELTDIRGARISHIFQNPQGALNPVYTVGWQLIEAIQLHQDVEKDDAREEAVDLLSRVGIPEASARLDDYPHELSGGMKQRVMIAMALACQPDLLIADEPTTALDVTIQAQILRLLRDLQEEFEMGIIFITHDLGVVAEIADRVVVMYAGKVMERGSVYDVFDSPSHPYTKALLECLPGHGSLGGIPGSLPDPIDPPEGCRFADRCPYAIEECRTGAQPAFESAAGDGHEVSCVHYQTADDPSVLERVGGDTASESGTQRTGRTDGGTDESGKQERTTGGGRRE